MSHERALSDSRGFAIARGSSADSNTIHSEFPDPDWSTRVDLPFVSCDAHKNDMLSLSPPRDFPRLIDRVISVGEFHPPPYARKDINFSRHM